MVAWWWLVIVAFVSFFLGLLVEALCIIVREDQEADS